MKPTPRTDKVMALSLELHGPDNYARLREVAAHADALETELADAVRERDEAIHEAVQANTKLASVWLPKDQEEADGIKAERDQLRKSRMSWLNA